MLKKTHTFIASLAVFVGVVALATTPVAALDLFPQCDPANPVSQTEVCEAAQNDNLLEGNNSLIQRVVNILILVVGIISVIMIVIGGIRYVLSGGDQAGITNAKNTIIYAVVGLVVAVIAYSLVNFVLANL